MLKSNKIAASKFGLDTALIEEKANTKKNIDLLGNDLTFVGIRERDRTKHVHRLHPYLGKFIPQLVEVFLRKFFRKGDTVLDPFSGSGTTLIEANALGINSIGVELSPFNILIQRVKLGVYDIDKLETEIKDALARLRGFSGRFIDSNEGLFDDGASIETDNDYLNTWFADRTIQELLFYRGIIDEYKYSDVLKIILSRSARSARLIPHYDLARPKEPVREPYWCIKHKRWCKPIGEALKFIRRYSLDSLKRVKEFDRIRTNATIEIIEDDSRTVNLPDKYELDGIFTSPPYVGLIDYHEQHKYAYELLGLPRLDQSEIGPARKGQSNAAKQEYVEGITSVFVNIARYLKPKSPVFIVANDKLGLYPDIGERCGFLVKDVFNRPVLMRTERDSNKYFESVFFFESR